MKEKEIVLSNYALKMIDDVIDCRKKLGFINNDIELVVELAIHSYKIDLENLVERKVSLNEL